MRTRLSMVAALIVYSGALVVATITQNTPAKNAARTGGWLIPRTARTEKNVLTVTDAVRIAGRKLYEVNCQRCHGKAGKGDGPDAGPVRTAGMDLTGAARVVENPDGVVFYKLWNGRQAPPTNVTRTTQMTQMMPALSETASREQVWAIVAYVQTLRARNRSPAAR